MNLVSRNFTFILYNICGILIIKNNKYQFQYKYFGKENAFQASMYFNRKQISEK